MNQGVDPHTASDDKNDHEKKGRRFDLCVLTGDYRTELHGPIREVMASLQRVVQGIDSRPRC